MGYKFQTDLSIENPFFLEMIQKFNGKRVSMVKNHSAYLVKCPCCQKKKAIFGSSRDRDTFVLLCTVDICPNQGGLVLHEVI